jgi:hypothetical protein
VRSVSDIRVLNHKTVVAVVKRPGSTETNLGAADTKALTLAGLKEEGWKDTVGGLVGQDGGKPPILPLLALLCGRQRYP